MVRVVLSSSSVALALWMCAGSAPLRAETRPIDPDRSTLTVFVYKSGLFSALADDHVIQAPLADGMISTDAPLGIEVSVRSANLKVLDPGLSSDKRAEVQARMLGPEVLDSTAYPTIEFASTSIEPAGPDRWSVTGRLTIHGVTRALTFPVTQKDGRYRGTAVLRQRDFGIEPISIVGGTVKVRDELKVEFDVIPRR